MGLIYSPVRCLWIHGRFSHVAVSLRVLTEKETLQGVPVFAKKDESVAVAPEVSSEASSARVAQQTSTLMSLLMAHESLSTASKASRVWLGEGLGSIPRRAHDRML